jgi:ankyrin repeat protein
MGSAELVQYILKHELQQQQQEKHQADCVVSNSRSNCAHMAAYSGNVSLLRILSHYGFNLFEPNKAGDLPLHISIRKGHDDFSIELIMFAASKHFNLPTLDYEN